MLLEEPQTREQIKEIFKNKKVNLQNQLQN